MNKPKKNFNPVAAFVQLKTELESANVFLTQLKSLPNCYICSGRVIDPDTKQPFCQFCIVDDGIPSRYNCPLFEALPVELKEDY